MLTLAVLAGLALTPYPSTEGTLIVCNQAEHNVYLSSLKTGKLVKKVPTGQGPHETAVSPSGKLVAVTNYGAREPGHSLTIIELPKGEVVKTIELGTYTRPHGVAWVDENRLVCTSETTANVVLVDVKNAKVERPIATEGKGSHMLALANDRKRVYTANVGSSDVSAMDFATGKKLWQVPVGQGSEGIGISPDGKWIWTGNTVRHSVSVVDTGKGETVKTIDTEGRPYRAQFTVDGKRVLIPTPVSGTLTVFDAAKMEVVKKISMNGGSEKFRSEQSGENPGAVGVTVHPNGKYAYAAVQWAFAVAVIDLQKLEVVGKLEAGMSPDGVAVSKIEIKP